MSQSLRQFQAFSAQKALRKDKNTCLLPAARLQPLPAVSPPGAQDTRNTGYLPRRAEMQMTGMISVSPDSRDGTPLQCSCLENPMDGGAWWAAVHRVAKSRARLSDFTFTFHFHALEKEMATHSSVLAWRIPGTVEPGGLPSMGSHRVGHH